MPSRGEIIQNMNRHHWRRAQNSSRWRKEWWIPVKELVGEELRLLEEAGCGEGWMVLGAYKFRLYPNSVARILADQVATPMFGRPWHPPDPLLKSDQP